VLVTNVLSDLVEGGLYLRMTGYLRPVFSPSNTLSAHHLDQSEHGSISVHTQSILGSSYTHFQPASLLFILALSQQEMVHKQLQTFFHGLQFAAT